MLTRTDVSWMDDRTVSAARVRHHLEVLSALAPPQALLWYLMGQDDEPLTEAGDLPLLAGAGCLASWAGDRLPDRRARRLAGAGDADRCLQAGAVLRGAPFAATLTEPVGVDGSGQGWDVVEQINPASGVVTVFAFQNAGGGGSVRVQLPHLQPGTTYRVAPSTAGCWARRGRRSDAGRTRHRAVVAVRRAAAGRRAAVAAAGPRARLQSARWLRCPSAPWSAEDARAVTHLMLLVVALRVVTALVAFLVNVTFPLDRPEQFTVLADTTTSGSVPRYDSGWYFGIASEGYRWVAGRPQQPGVLPGLSVADGRAWPVSRRHSGRLLLRRHRRLVGGVGGGGRLRLRDGAPRPGAGRAWHAALLTFVFPFAFFFGLVYSEALFLLGLSAAIYGLRTRRWRLGAAAGALMTATRVNGVMAVPALVWLAWRAPALTRGPSRAVLAGVATSAGFLGYCGFNWA